MESNDKTAEDFLKEKGIIKEGYSKWICRFEDGKEFDIGELIRDYFAQQLKEYKEVIRELLPLSESGQAYYRQNPGFNWVKEREKSAVIIHKARKLIDQTDAK